MTQRDYKLLEKINNPNDLKKIDKSKLESVCKELRDFIIDK